MNNFSYGKEKSTTGCMVCKTDIKYLETPVSVSCYYCKKESLTSAVCQNNHFVCDRCHSKDTADLIIDTCLNAKEKDLITLFKRIKSNSKLPVHGPEYHGIVPGVVLASYVNSGGILEKPSIKGAIKRGLKVQGGSCGFLGACGSALGVTNAFAVILKANPYKPVERQKMLNLTSQLLANLGKYSAGRCCQRDCYLSLLEASKLSCEYFGIHLDADDKMVCTQFKNNKECIYSDCPLYKNKASK
jgi:hypothetical protein